MPIVALKSSKSREMGIKRKKISIKIKLEKLKGSF
jgi:hypothetical protein